MEEKKPISADDYKNQPHLAEPGEHVVIHGLVYRVLRHTWKPMRAGKKGRPVKGAYKVPKDLILRLLGIYQPNEVPASPVAQPEPVPEVVQRDENVTLDPGMNNGTLMVTPDVY